MFLRSATFITLSLTLSACATTGNSSHLLSIETNDVNNFWAAFDNASKSESPSERAEIFEREYIQKGTPGLRQFVAVKGCTPQKYAELTSRFPKYWAAVRARTLTSQLRAKTLGPEISKVTRLYPEAVPASLYFVVGCMNSGGTTSEHNIFIGTEFSLGDSQVDTSELPAGLGNWLRKYYSTRPAETLDLLNTHEYVHTQQTGPGKTLVAQAIYEGAADFIAELATGKLPDQDYVRYGPQHENTIKSIFLRDSNKETFDGWLYGPGNKELEVGDLGYFVGYRIVHAYYYRSKDKQAAIKDILNLSYGNQKDVEDFVKESRYFE